MSVTSVDRSFDYLEDKTASLETALNTLTNDIATGEDHESQGSEDWFIIMLELKKLLVIVDHVRSEVLDLEHNKTKQTASSKYRRRLKELNDKLEGMNFAVHRQQEKEQKLLKQQQTQKQNNNSNNNRTAELFSSSELKNRKTGQSLSVEEKLAIDKKTQEEISSELLSMVSSIKTNAITLGEKVIQDNTVLRSTTEALNNTSLSMDSVGTRLKTYRSSTALGWWFYILSTLFLILAIILGMTIIRLFPKW